MKMIRNIILILLCVLCFVYLGELSIMTDPFSIKLQAWPKLVGILWIIIGARFLRHWYWCQLPLAHKGKEFSKLNYLYENQGYEEAIVDQEIKEKDSEEVDLTPNFRLILYRGNVPEVREQLENIGILPMSSPIGKSGYILVGRNRYCIVDSIDESTPELYDCGTSADLFIKKCQDSLN